MKSTHHRKPDYCEHPTTVERFCGYALGKKCLRHWRVYCGMDCLAKDMQDPRQQSEWAIRPISVRIGPVKKAAV